MAVLQGLRVRGGRQTEGAKMIYGHTLDACDMNGGGALDILNKPYTWDTPRGGSVAE